MIYIVHLDKPDLIKVEKGDLKMIIRLRGEGDEKYFEGGMIQEDDVLLISDLVESEVVCAKVTDCTPVYTSLEELLNEAATLKEYGISDCSPKQAIREIKEKYLYLNLEIRRKGVYGIRFECF